MTSLMYERERVLSFVRPLMTINDRRLCNRVNGWIQVHVGVYVAVCVRVCDCLRACMWLFVWVYVVVCVCECVCVGVCVCVCVSVRECESVKEFLAFPVLACHGNMVCSFPSVHFHIDCTSPNDSDKS